MAFGAEEAGAIRQNLDLAAYALELSAQGAAGATPGLRLRPLSLLQLSAFDEQDTLLRHWPRPAVNIGTHYGYAAQWFGLCALMAGLYVWFQLVRPRLGARR
jgi:surfeit locus 1 family protein